MIRSRNNRGSILIIGLVGMFLITSILVMLGIEIHLVLMRQNRAQTATQAAALAAAGDISRIMVRDARWGFVALSDHPAAGRRTLAADGEPLPVSGINTILATARQEKVLARELQNQDLETLAQADLMEAKQSCRNFQTLLEESVKPQSAQKNEDMNGVRLQPYQHALEQLTRNMPEFAEGTAKLEQLDITLGWLEEGSTTLTPDPDREAGDKKKKYAAFVNLPVGNEDFYFAGLSDQPRLVNFHRFRPGDGKRFCSAVLISSKIAFYSRDKKLLYQLCTTAAAIPHGNVDKFASGSLVVHLPQGKLKGAESLKQLLDSQSLKKNQVPICKASGGDYPVQPGTKLVNTQQTEALSSSVGRAVFDWLRTCRATARTAEVVSVLTTPLNPGSDAMDMMLVYNFDRQGNSKKRILNNGAGLPQTVAESQDYVMATAVSRTDKGLLGLTIRNQVAHIGEHCGQHGGQPLPNELPGIQPIVDRTTTTLRQSSIRGGLAVCIQLFATPG